MRYDLQSATAAFMQGDATLDAAMAILAQADLQPDEVDTFIRAVSKQTGVGLRPLQARVKKEQKEREQRARNASLMSSMQAKAEGRIIRDRPDPENELGPTVSFVDQALADDTTSHPPMRNAYGVLVRVEEREPWALHLLTSDGVNAKGTEAAETIKPPAEPTLAELTAIATELLIEKYIAWVETSILGFAALPTPFIRALMEFPNSAIPVVRSINTRGPNGLTVAIGPKPCCARVQELYGDAVQWFTPDEVATIVELDARFKELAEIKRKFPGAEINS